MKRAVLVAVLVLSVGIVVSAVPGVLDTTFNGTGLATTDFAIGGIGNFHVATAVAVDSQNRPVAVGLTTAGPDITIYDVAIARYNADGTPDTTFNGTGKVIRDFGGDDRAAAVAIDDQDRILVAGSTDWKPGCNAVSCGGNFNFFLARFNVDGSIDSSFGDHGRILVDMGSNDDWATAMVIDPAGRMVVAGWNESLDHAEIAMMRVLPSGVLDASFDGDGIVVSDLSPSFFAATTAIALDRLGRIVIAADIGGFSGVARYQANGSLDSQFQEVVIGGGTMHPECSYSALKAVGVDAADRIVATGYCAGGTFEGPGIEALTVRLLPEGGFDPDFGADGVVGAVVSHFGAGGEQGAMALALGPVGEITIAGVAQGCGSDMLIARYDPTGALDTHFAADGSGSTLINFDPVCSDDRANAMATDAHGNFVLAGSTAFSNSNFAVARVLTYHPDFNFSPVTAIDLAPGGSGSTTLTINSIDGFHEFLKIMPFSGVPAGFTWTFDGIIQALSITPPAFGSVNTTFGVSVAIDVVPGQYSLSVFDARLPDIAHTALVTVNVVTTPFSFARTISGFAQAGFIDNAGIARSLTGLLANAISSLDAGNVDAALGQLRALEHHVNAQAGKHIATVATDGGQTINPVAILLANADDLIRQASGQ